MGMIWRSTMPMLSTLAALVIIVHSAEEELDPGFRTDLRPRVVDPGTNSYEQPWKAIDAEPLAEQSTHADDWDENSPEELTARRRPVRKRKRRPQTSSETEPEGRYRENRQGPYPDIDYHDSYQTTELPRRRRKRPDVRPYRWEDETVETEREIPMRRRGLRRKRPTFDSDPQFSEYNWKQKDDQREDIEHTNSYYAVDNGRKHKSPNADHNLKIIDESEEEVQNITGQQMESNSNDMNINNKFRGMQAPSQEHIKSEETITIDNNKQYPTKVYAEFNYYKRPKQLTELSAEMVNSKSSEKADSNANGNIVSSLNKNGAVDFNKKAKEYDPIDPLTLKEILKKSNGTSLSEILQQHNLSLSDLLRGKGEAILALNKDGSREHQFEDAHQLQKAESQYTLRKTTNANDVYTTPISFNADELEVTTAPIRPHIQIMEIESNKNDTKSEKLDSRFNIVKRRFPTGNRRKLRMRPMLNITTKVQLSRDLIALSARKYLHNNKTLSKSKEWKEVIPMMINKSKLNEDTSGDDITETVPTTTDGSVDTTMPDLNILNSSIPLNITESGNVLDNEVEIIRSSTTEPTTTVIIEVSPSELKDESENGTASRIVRPVADNLVLRPRAFNNRLKRKRLKQKTSTTENPVEHLTNKLFGMGNLVSASQFIERTQKPHTTITQGNTEYATELEDFMTTQVPTTVHSRIKSTGITTFRYTTIPINKNPLPSTTTSTTEQSAKFEIEEILNDSMTSERLERILRERNMTVNELVKHRERGSSHVHLADIFHNASKEPNPPEPFLTKSSIEPISKETYPLRAILEANIHETTARSPTTDTTKAQSNDLNIPVVMDFGNNVNENGENMGIISLFNQLNEKDESIDRTELRQDSSGTPYLSSIFSVNATSENDTNRESRVLVNDEDIEETRPIEKIKNSQEEDVDGDGLIILEDLQHLLNNIASASDEKLEIKMSERNEANTDKQGILNKMPNTTRSVATATACILGLATILFLLTYIVLKYKHQRNRHRKDSFSNDHIPSPVFENRKNHKNHCSSRSISPMISTSNIYTMSTLDSRNGKESPDYMWNSLRKPFQ